MRNMFHDPTTGRVLIHWTDFDLHKCTTVHFDFLNDGKDYAVYDPGCDCDSYCDCDSDSDHDYPGPDTVWLQGARSQDVDHGNSIQGYNDMENNWACIFHCEFFKLKAKSKPYLSS